MSMPIIEKPKRTFDRCQSITDLIESIALIETGLSHILNAEGEKIQKVIKHGEDVCVPIDDIIRVNDSVNNTISSVSKLEMVLQNKLEAVKSFDITCKDCEKQEEAYMFACDINANGFCAEKIMADEQLLKGFTTNECNNVFTANIEGTYLISYRISLAEECKLTANVCVSGNVVPSSVVHNTAKDFATSFILELKSGDTLTLNRSFCSCPISFSCGVCAFLSAVKID